MPLPRSCIPELGLLNLHVANPLCEAKGGSPAGRLPEGRSHVLSMGEEEYQEEENRNLSFVYLIDFM